ncbi:hypothetical protein B0H19DRAFT_1181291 [Mycena capillaripes]|nr:hypothetical protein B0H19DRAFT_1181291 [Mycena capillaripes]
MSPSLCTAPPAIPRCPPADLKAMQQRIRELESMCSIRQVGLTCSASLDSVRPPLPLAVVGEFVNVYNTVRALRWSQFSLLICLD